MKKRLLHSIPAAVILTTATAGAASLSLGSRTQVSSNNANFDISVFDGAASYNDAGIGGTEPGTATFTNPLGDGTVLAYNFFHSPNSEMTSYASNGGRIPVPVVPAANINGTGENWSNVWTVTDPVGFTTTKDFSSVDVPNTFARSAEVDGSIDISGLTDGQIYIPHGTFVNQWSLTLTMSGPGQTDLVALDAATVNGPSTNQGWISDFAFDNADGLYDTITYNYTNADRDGSRARFMGVILDGSETVIPEPSAIALLGLAGLGLLRRRR